MIVSDKPDRPVSVALTAAFFMGKTAVLPAMGAQPPASGGVGLLAAPLVPGVGVFGGGSCSACCH
ncbi:hypothetical protein [Amycolatopsis sp. DSM 110486]|uniref:hypothetical protein n=1 Tax=Amycolatopsis sp. DSM 110486 TaxID=2865832 RepID=UPI001C6A0285|nr:hypothetical protein [Amycolatopsis sp. DSM 110486]QYN16508.1 hypothetical protein K1T34_26880 [Amycolatopsis sp. DSM 110486]